MNKEECKKRGCTPLAKIVAHAECGVDPKIMGTGPIPAVLKTVSINNVLLVTNVILIQYLMYHMYLITYKNNCVHD